MGYKISQTTVCEAEVQWHPGHLSGLTGQSACHAIHTGVTATYPDLTSSFFGLPFGLEACVGVVDDVAGCFLAGVEGFEVFVLPAPAPLVVFA